jgi:hypothetical protein
MAKKKQGSNLPQLRIADLKQKGLLETSRQGTVTWHNPFVDFDIEFGINNVCVGEDGGGFLWLESLTHYAAGKMAVEKIGKTISLKGSGCGFGGTRTWFACPKCEKQAGILFLHDAELACRKCHNLSYRSQNTRNRMTPVATLERLKKAVGRTHYRGKPTRTYLRYMRRRDQTMKSLDAISGSLLKRQ